MSKQSGNVPDAGEPRVPSKGKDEHKRFGIRFKYRLSFLRGDEEPSVKWYVTRAGRDGAMVGMRRRTVGPRKLPFYSLVEPVERGGAIKS
jgi:hypothetical protein